MQHWNGLVGDYYAGRWNLLLTAMRQAVTTGTQINTNQYSADVLQFEKVCCPPSLVCLCADCEVVSSLAGLGCQHKQLPRQSEWERV